jgi:hypothetical protein
MTLTLLLALRLPLLFRLPTLRKTPFIAALRDNCFG